MPAASRLIALSPSVTSRHFPAFFPRFLALELFPSLAIYCSYSLKWTWLGPVGNGVRTLCNGVESATSKQRTATKKLATKTGTMLKDGTKHQRSIGYSLPTYVCVSASHTGHEFLLKWWRPSGRGGSG